jgi:hypothetical protein
MAKDVWWAQTNCNTVYAFVRHGSVASMCCGRWTNKTVRSEVTENMRLALWYKLKQHPGMSQQALANFPYKEYGIRVSRSTTSTVLGPHFRPQGARQVRVPDMSDCMNMDLGWLGPRRLIPFRRYRFAIFANPELSTVDTSRMLPTSDNPLDRFSGVAVVSFDHRLRQMGQLPFDCVRYPTYLSKVTLDSLVFLMHQRTFLEQICFFILCSEKEQPCPRSSIQTWDIYSVS